MLTEKRQEEILKLVNKNGSVTHDKKGETYTAQGDYPEETWYDEPFFPSEATIHSAFDAYKIVTSEVGATMPCRDDQHLRVVRETLEGSWTYKGSRSGIRGEIDHEDDCGGWEAFPEEIRPANYDTDQDGMPDWYEKITGSDASVVDNNADPDNDGWTLLEDFLEFMAHPYVVLKPGASAAIDMQKHFCGFTQTPVYSYNIKQGEMLIETNVGDKWLNIKALNGFGVAVVTMQVVDGEGTSYSRRFSVAVTDDETALQHPTVDFNTIEAKSREFFTLDGRKVTQMHPHETYLMKVTDVSGHVHTVKIIKN